MGRASKGRATAAAAPVVILVRPQLGENIGMAARAMLNCGLSALRLVSPRDGWPNAKAVANASGADSVIDAARLFDSAEAAIADLERVYATTARHRGMKLVNAPTHILLRSNLTGRHAPGKTRIRFSKGMDGGLRTSTSSSNCS